MQILSKIFSDIIQYELETKLAKINLYKRENFHRVKEEKCKSEIDLNNVYL